LAGVIGTSSVALRTLDRNGDGGLAPVEVIPDPIDQRAATILFRLDANRDRKSREKNEQTKRPRHRESCSIRRIGTVMA